MYNRIVKGNRLFAGVWYGCSKPDMSLFLKPLAMSIRKLCMEGIRHPILLYMYMCMIYD